MTSPIHQGQFGTRSHDDRPAYRRFGNTGRRSTLHHSPLVLIEDGYIPPAGPFAPGFESHFQIGLTYFGAFSYAVGKRKWLVDANRALFITPGWEVQEEHPVEGLGHAAILINPATELLAEVTGRSDPATGEAFLHGTLQSSMRLKLLVQYLLQGSSETSDPLRNDEWTISALLEAMKLPAKQTARPSKVVAQAKELIHAHVGQRLSLGEIAGVVGVSPVYLTQEFSRQEGIPLYRYQMRLRLAQALLELPHCDDITGLALDLGFGSHSHFTVTFRKAFGLTPAAYRSTIGTRPSQVRGCGRRAAAA